ncbi:MAG: hypothetical protein VKJ05_05870 [Synechococcaceae cyanobacterium]|nr:hypothetical protein [Synechococcaceae cyanobacterium]
MRGVRRPCPRSLAALALILAPAGALAPWPPGAAKAQAPEPDPGLLDTATLDLAPGERLRFQRPAEEPGPAELQAAAAPGNSSAPPTPSAWAGTLEIYGFLPWRSTNRTTISGFTAESSLSLGQVLDALQSTVSLRGSVEHGRLGLLTDISYVKLRGEGTRERGRDRIRLGDGQVLGALGATRERLGDASLAGSRPGERWNGRLRQRLRERRERLGEVERERGVLARRLASRLAARHQGPGTVSRTFRTTIDAEQGLYDLAVRYRLGARESAIADPGTVTVIPYAGIRLLDVSLDIESELRNSQGLGRAVARSWGSPVVQPLLGTQAQLFVSPRLRLFMRGDAAGFGVSGADSFSGNAQAGLGYAVGNSTQIDVSWRYLHLAANNGKDPANAYVIGQNGVELGVKFFF